MFPMLILAMGLQSRDGKILYGTTYIYPLLPTLETCTMHSNFTTQSTHLGCSPMPPYPQSFIPTNLYHINPSHTPNLYHIPSISYPKPVPYIPICHSPIISLYNIYPYLTPHDYHISLSLAPNLCHIPQLSLKTCTTYHYLPITHLPSIYLPPQSCQT